MFPQKDFAKVSAYFAFESGGLCLNEAQPNEDLIKDIKDKSYKCDADDSGYYNHKCREWYQFGKEQFLLGNKKDFLVDLYEAAGVKQLVSTICTNLDKNGEFYGLVCIDIDIT